MSLIVFKIRRLFYTIKEEGLILILKGSYYNANVVFTCDISKSMNALSIRSHSFGIFDISILNWHNAYYKQLTVKNSKRYILYFKIRENGQNHSRCKTHLFWGQPLNLLYFVTWGGRVSVYEGFIPSYSSFFERRSLIPSPIVCNSN